MLEKIRWSLRRCNWCSVITAAMFFLALTYGIVIVTIRIDGLRFAVERLSVLAEKNKQDLLQAITTIERRSDHQ